MRGFPTPAVEEPSIGLELLRTWLHSRLFGTINASIMKESCDHVVRAIDVIGAVAGMIDAGIIQTGD